jgi:4-hydroxybenzoate polyprenyltransferase
LNLLRCAHPEAAFGVTVLTGVLALSTGRGTGTIWVLAAVLAGQLYTGWSNDYVDRERDLRAARRSKPAATGEISPRRLLIAAVTALALCVPLSLASGLAAALAHLGAVGAATLYNLALKSTAFSVVPYAVAFALLPAFVTLGLPASRLPPAWALGAGALLGAGAHFTQVLPDIPEDLRQGVRGLPQRVGQRASAVAAAILLGAAAVLIALGPQRRASSATALALLVSLALVTAVLASALSGREDRTFRLTLVAAAVIVLSFLLSGGSL